MQREQQIDMYNNSQTQSSRPGSYQNYDPHAWKLRRALQPKDEQPQIREKTEDRNIVRYYPEPPVSSLSPLDYVKNRIAEVMRTEEEGASKSSDSPNPEMVIDETEQQQQPPPQPPPVSFIPTSHTYTYPFNALNITATAPPPVSLPTPTVVKTGSDPIPEPAPILSAQYEPLSDED